jgi:RNA polymerase sigma factor (sigma-70 family)
MIQAINTEDQALLTGILAADGAVIERMYERYLPGIIRYIQSNSGSVEDARDVFQEGMMVIYKKCASGSFELHASLETYLFVVCRNLWLSHLRKTKPVFLEGGEDWEDPDEDTLKIMETQVREQLFYRHFRSLGARCKRILELFFQKTPMKVIADMLGTSESYVKKRKHICKEQLISAIKSDPHFREIIS